MAVTVKREDLLQKLELVRSGLAPRSVVQQSTCFIFQNGRVHTFNGEIACKCKSGLPKDFIGAVQAEPLMKVLSKLMEDEITIDPTETELLIQGKRRKAGIRMEMDILLPIDKVEVPEKTSWAPLHEDFIDAVKMVQEVAGTDQSAIKFTYIHIHPKWVEASDNSQAARYKLLTGVAQATLIRRESLKHIVPLGMSEYAETPNWIHFRNPAGLVFSCLRFIEEYPNLKPLFEFQGETMRIPRGLMEAAETAQIFSQENEHSDQLLVTLGNGKIKIKGQGVSGWYEETKKTDYTGRTLSFLASPRLLMELTKRFTECEIAEDRLKVVGAKLSYMTSLGTLDAAQDTPAVTVKE